MHASYSYTPFGRSDQGWQPGENRFRFASGEVDRLELYYFRARYYSPELRRFIAEDPIGLGGGVNPYVYAGNDPVNSVDPTGLCSEEFSTYGGSVGDPPMTTTQVPCPIYTRWMFPRNDGAGWLDGGWGTEDPGAGITGFDLRSATGAGGIAAGAIGFSYIRGFGDNLEWRGQNGKWYPIKPAPGKTRAFRGSGSVGGRTRPLMMGKALRYAGRAFAAANVGLSLYEAGTALDSGNTGAGIWYTADAVVGVSAVGTGPIGLVGGTGYYVARFWFGPQ